LPKNRGGYTVQEKYRVGAEQSKTKVAKHAGKEEKKQ